MNNYRTNFADPGDLVADMVDAIYAASMKPDYRTALLNVAGGLDMAGISVTRAGAAIAMMALQMIERGAA